MSPTKSICPHRDAPYAGAVPRLWNDTVEAHRRDVREAILEATARLVASRGVRSVTMSEIAEETGIGRATLYKYFADVEAILVAWHERHVHVHLQQLAAIGERPGTAAERLEAVLESYALVIHERDRSDVAGLLHRQEHAAHAEHQLRSFIASLLVEGADDGDVRSDVAADELAAFCLHALAAARAVPSMAAVRRLVGVTVAGLRPPPKTMPARPRAPRTALGRRPASGRAP